MRALLALLFLTSAAHAGKNEVSFGPEVRALRSDSANAMTSESYSGGHLSYARALDVVLAPDLSLGGPGSFSGGGAVGPRFTRMQTEVGATTVSAGGRARYRLARWLDATVHADLGALEASVDIRDGSGHSATDSAWGISAHGALGLEAIARTRSRFGVGVRLELGYTETSKVALTATPDGVDDGSLQLPMQAAPLGRLDLSGPTFGATITVQF